MGTPRLILASASPRRRELLAHLGLPFEVRPAGVDEDAGDAAPLQAAEELARRKAEAVAAAEPEAVVIGSDTVVVLDGTMLAKPADCEEARGMLRALRARAHEVITGVAVASGGRVRSACARTEVVMRAYSDAETDAWIATGEPFDKAGGYAIQDLVFRPVERFQGCECNVIGLPLWTLRALLETGGVATDPPDFDRCAGCPAREG